MVDEASKMAHNKINTLPTYILVLVGTIDFVLIVIILGGNILTICAVKLSRKLSVVLSNLFIFNLALSDIMVAVSFPYHYAFFIAETLSTTSDLCLLRFVLIIFACSSSVCNLLGIAMDRYIAIVYPLHYTHYMTKKVAIVIIISSWILALGMSSIPIFWNRWNEEKICVSLNKVLMPEYINFLIIPMFASVWIGMILVYMRIWREAMGHAKRLRDSTNYKYGKSFDSKSVQVVLLILGCFSICWLPFYVIILIIKLDSQIVYEITLRLAVANSGMNPIIYAWKNSNFRKIFCCLLHCKLPNGVTNRDSFITNHSPSRSLDNTKNNNIYVIKQSDCDNEMQCHNIRFNELAYKKEKDYKDTVGTNIGSFINN